MSESWINKQFQLLIDKYAIDAEISELRKLLDYEDFSYFGTRKEFIKELDGKIELLSSILSRK